MSCNLNKERYGYIFMNPESKVRFSLFNSHLPYENIFIMIVLGCLNSFVNSFDEISTI
jgi:hypothetical protein